MRTVWVLALLAVVSMCMATVDATTPSFLIPRKHRNGQFYQDLLRDEREEQGPHNLGAAFTPNTTANFFPQWIDHSNHSKGTFQQRYFIDTSAWTGNGTALLYISGEQIAYGSPSGFVAQWGHSVGAIMFTLEHRWYGDSQVGPDYTDMTLLKTLTVSNALADLNYFMTYAETNILNKTVDWVSAGGSYAGALSAWLKMTYPNRLKAAWSSSGVVNPRFDYADYEGHIVSVLPRACVKSLQAAFDAVYAIWDDPVAYQQLLAAFSLPNTTTKVDFAEDLADTYAGAVQYGAKEKMCNDYMLPANHSDPIGQFLKFYKYMNPPPTSNVTDMSGYLWTFQCCSQMAFWQIGYPRNDITTCIRPTMIDTDYYMNICKDTYYPSIFPDLYSFNKEMGGATPNATHVIALQGSDDPFWPAGVQQQLSPTYPLVVAYCANCGHCGDMGTPRSTDPANLQRQRRYIVQYLNLWLGMTYNVSFTVTDGILMDDFQANLLGAMNLTNWASAMVYQCTATNCMATFSNETLAQESVELANSGRIPGATKAHMVVPGGSDDDDGDKLTRLAIVGIAVGGVVVLIVIGILISVCVRNRKQRDQDYRALN